MKQKARKSLLTLVLAIVLVLAMSAMALADPGDNTEVSTGNISNVTVGTEGDFTVTNDFDAGYTVKVSSDNDAVTVSPSSQDVAMGELATITYNVVGYTYRTVKITIDIIDTANPSEPAIIDTETFDITVKNPLSDAYVQRSAYNGTPYVDLIHGSTVTYDNSYYDSTTVYFGLAANTDYKIKSASYSSDRVTNQDLGTSGSYTIPANEGTVTIKATLVSDNAAAVEFNYEFKVAFTGNTKLDDFFASSTNSDRYFYLYDMVPSFSADVTQYYVFMPYSSSTQTLYFYAEAQANAATVYLNGTDAIHRFGTNGYIDAHDIKNTLNKNQKFDDTIYVVNGSTSAAGRYNITTFAAHYNASRDDSLADFKVYSATSSSDLSSSSKRNEQTVKGGTTKTINIFVDQNDKYARLYLDSYDSDAYMFIDGKLFTSSYLDVTLNSNTSKATVVEVTVYAEDCETYTTYTINIYRGLEGHKLSALTVSGLSKYITPTFDADTINYTGYVENRTSSTTIYAKAASSNATVSIYSSTSNSYQNGTGSASGSFMLNVGLNTFTVTVREGTKTTSYYISIYRQPVLSSAKVVVSNQKVFVNNVEKDLYAYNIDGYNFMQLRDLAYILSGQTKNFNVTYNDYNRTATLTSFTAYTGSRTSSLASNPTVTASNQSFYLDKNQIYPMAYNADGYNYVMIRDVCALLNISCTYNDATRSLSLNANSSAVYYPPNTY